MRTLNEVNLDAAQSEVPWIIDFVKITFSNAPLGNCTVGSAVTPRVTEANCTGTWVETEDAILRICNHHHDIVVTEDDNLDYTYIATGQFLGFGDISDELEIKNNSLDLSLSGVGGTFTAVFVDSNVEGSLVEVSRGYYTESTYDFTDSNSVTTTIQGGSIVATPEPRWAGRINNASIQDDYNFTDEDKIIISVSCKSLFETLFKRQSGRYTSLQGYQKFNSEDKSMEFMASIALFTPSFGKDN